MWLMLICSIEDFLEQVSVRWEGYARPIRDVRRQVEDGIAIMVFRDLHEVLRTSICKKVHPFLGVKYRGCEILDEIIVYHVRSVGVEMVLPGLV